MDQPLSPRAESIERFRRAVAGAITRIADAGLDDAALAFVADRAEALERSMAAAEPASIAWGYTTVSGESAARGMFVLGLASGAPNTNTGRAGDEVSGTVVFAREFEGPRGGVHGGHIARVLDDISALACSIGGSGAALTASLNIRYRHLTPLGVALSLRATVTGIEGRRVRVSAAVYDGERVYAESEAELVRESG
jgi:acyl-coenzyme A thioesterase PaaI-like protein